MMNTSYRQMVGKSSFLLLAHKHYCIIKEKSMEVFIMKVRIGQLWKVPAFCLAAGYISFYVYVFFISRFGVTILPDGSYTTNQFVTTVFSFLLFGGTLFAGSYLFRNMTRKEIFLSATILVVFHLIVQTMQLLSSNYNLTFRIGLYMTYAIEWCRIISQLLHFVTKNVWIGAFAVCFAPYLFVLIRKK